MDGDGYRGKDTRPHATVYGLYAEVGTRNFFLSAQSQFRNLKEAFPQSQVHNF
jgi:hypothetical protein